MAEDELTGGRNNEGVLLGLEALQDALTLQEEELEVYEHEAKLRLNQLVCGEHMEFLRSDILRQLHYHATVLSLNRRIEAQAERIAELEALLEAGRQ